jgi:hypothetical protein
MQCRYLLLLPVMASMLSGQQSDTKPAEPEAIGVACYLDPVTHTIKALPNEQGKAVGKAKAGFAHVNATGFLDFVGVSSSFRVPVSEKNEFVFKLLNADLSRIKLYKGAQDSKKRLRRFEVTQGKTEVHLFGQATAETTTLDGISIELVKYGESSYELRAVNLEPGEYLIVGLAGDYTFGVH